jgi:ABC-type Fe3+ transport system substrate-binding protein
MRRALAALAVAAGFLPAICHAAPPRDNWQDDWQRTLDAAKAEGQLTVSAPSGGVWRAELARFQDAYPDIKLAMTAFSGRDFWARFMKEREVGQYLWDLRIGGYDAQLYQIKEAGHLQSVRDLLVLPEVTDDSRWIGGLDLAFLDREQKYVLSFVAVDAMVARFNKQFVGPTLAAADLIDPKWSGRISMADPRGGNALNGLGSLYKHHGADFVRTLLADQKPVLTNVPRQQMDWLMSGRYPIAFGLPSAMLVEYADGGGDVSMIGNMTGVTQISMGVGGISVPTRNPHPNATKVFVNWLLTKDVQERLMQKVKLNSRRADVPLGAPDFALDRDRIDEYDSSQSDDAKPYLDEVKKLLAETSKR